MLQTVQIYSSSNLLLVLIKENSALSNSESLLKRTAPVSKSTHIPAY